ncbi:unnamed protein product, partial [Vitis vinifera]
MATRKSSLITTGLTLFSIKRLDAKVLLTWSHNSLRQTGHCITVPSSLPSKSANLRKIMAYNNLKPKMLRTVFLPNTKRPKKQTPGQCGMSSKMKNPYMSSALWIIFSLFLSFSAPSHQDSYSPPPLPNPRILNAYTALQAWKHVILSDPKNFTSNWCGFDLGLLTDLALFHINSNRFCGTLPDSFRHLRLLYELDISNNRFKGQFPSVVLCLPSLKFLDIRYNEFEGDIPTGLFDLKLDAIFVNNNKFKSSLPGNIGNSPVSVIVFANNNLNGCLPSSLSKMAKTLNELIITNAGLKGCLSPEIGLLKNVTVFDVSSNELVGPLPETIGEMKSLEQLNVAHNKLSGEIPETICSLPNLENFTYSYNYFCGEPPTCLKLPANDDQKNCIPDRPMQRSPEECAAFLAQPVDCGAFGCLPRRKMRRYVDFSPFSKD